MTTAVVALATALAVMTVGLIWLAFSMAAERRAWVEERRELINRAIARHVGEVVALDRQGPGKQQVSQGPLDHPVAVGL